jgi:sporulation protein YlmC with PRC-barrel domain
MLIKVKNRNSINAVIKKQARRLNDNRKMTDMISWDNVMDKRVKSFEGEDIGKVENVNFYFIEVKDGLLAKRQYYVPKYSIQGFDDQNNLITVMTKQEIKNEFSADNPVADLWHAPKS